MAAQFQRGDQKGIGPAGNLWVRAALLSLSVGSLIFAIAAWAFRDSDYNTGVGQAVVQPIAFSHKHHVADDGIDCRYCHTTVETSASAGMPSTQICMSCHSQIWKDSPLLEPVRKSFAEDRPIEWNPVTRLPRFVYFHHAVHVRQGIGCTTCHGRIDQMPLAWKARPFTMKDCLSCHRDPDAYLRSSEDVFRTDWKPGMESAAQSSARARERRIPHPDTDPRLLECNTCHR